MSNRPIYPPPFHQSPPTISVQEALAEMDALLALLQQLTAHSAALADITQRSVASLAALQAQHPVRRR